MRGDSRPRGAGKRGGKGGGRDDRERDRDRSPSGPYGVPKKSEAIRNAQTQYEDALAAAREARGKLDSAQANVKKVEKTARQQVARKVADTDKLVKAKLADQLARAKNEAEVALNDTLYEVKAQLRTELAEKVADLKKEYEEKIQTEQDGIRKMHEQRTLEDERILAEEADKKVEEARRNAEDDSSLREWQEKAELAASAMQEEEDKLLTAKKKLENLTGEPVKEMRSTRPPRGAAPAVEDRAARRAPVAQDGYEQCAEEEYEYSDYSDAELEAPPAQAQGGRYAQPRR